MTKCKTCGLQHGRGLPSRLPDWACEDCQGAYEDACEARAEARREAWVEEERAERTKR